MPDEGLRKASHIGLWIIVFSIGAWLVWSATHATTDNTKNLPGSQDLHKESRYYGLLSMGIDGCSYPHGVEGAMQRLNGKDNSASDTSKH